MPDKPPEEIDAEFEPEPEMVEELDDTTGLPTGRMIPHPPRRKRMSRSHRRRWRRSVYLFGKYHHTDTLVNRLYNTDWISLIYFVMAFKATVYVIETPLHFESWHCWVPAVLGTLAGYKFLRSIE